MIVDYYHSEKNFAKAYEIIGKMKQRSIRINFFLEKKTLMDIYRAVGVNIDFGMEEEENNNANEIEERY